MKLFQPKQVFFEEDALAYPLGKTIYNKYVADKVPVQIIPPQKRLPFFSKNFTPQQSYREGKQTLVVSVKRDLRLSTCKPSADFEFAIATSCPGGCEYCYLQTHLGKKPFIKVYVNLEEILTKIKDITEANLPKTTTFEAASSSDPLAVEHITHSLTRTIEFFGELEQARMRVVTKFDAVDPLLDLKHQKHTKFRFSLNTPYIIEQFEHNTASLAERIAAAQKMATAGYPIGFIIAPLFIYKDYKADYEQLIFELAQTLKGAEELSFELISHRFTKSAKKIIQERFPNTKLDMSEEARRLKFGKYGLVKYIYPEKDYLQLKELMINLIKDRFPQAAIEYFT